MSNTVLFGQKDPVVPKCKYQGGESRSLFSKSSFYKLRWKKTYFSHGPKEVTVCVFVSISLYLSANNFWPH